MNDLRNYLKTSFSKSALLDTGVIADFLVGDKRVREFFEEFVFSGQMTPVVSTQTVCELFMAVRDKREETSLDNWLSTVFDIADIKYEIARDAGRLKRGNGARTGDAIIAATAAALRLPLVTTKPELYRKAEIKLFRPHA